MKAREGVQAHAGTIVQAATHQHCTLAGAGSFCMKALTGKLT